MSTQGNGARKREEAFDRLGAIVREMETGEVPDRVSLAGRERLIAALASPTARVGAPRRANVTRAAWAGGGILAAAAAVLLVVHLRHAPLASWSAENAVTAEGGYVGTARPDSSATLRFATGANVELAGGSRGRVVDASASRARVVLEQGHASVRGDGHPQLSFLIEAGPYALKSAGSTYDVTWSGEMLEVRVASGAVTVQGPLATEGLTLHGDQRLVAQSADGGTLQVEKTSSANDAPRDQGARGAVDDSPTPPLPATGSPSSPRAGSPSRPSLTWTQRVAAGEYDGVLRDADARGTDASLQRGSLADVSALADAARYGGRPALAKRALSTERARFGTSAEARTAAFLLGRIAEDSDGDTSAAIGWYDRYLAEAPRGPLASEALGRKMMLVLRTSGPDAAKPIAEQYLRRFPNGSYAVVARQHASTP